MPRKSAHRRKPQNSESANTVEGSTIPENNGLIINKWYFPPELIQHFLSFLDPILNGRLVCKAWQIMIDAPSFWRGKVLREVPGATEHTFHKDLNWSDYYQLCVQKPLERNLLKNGSAEDGFLHWSTPASFYGSEWAIENEPVGCDQFPTGISRCFVTSFDWGSAKQRIYLNNCGLSANFMKHVKPNIHIEEWHAGRYDCGYRYKLMVTLFTSALEVVDSFNYTATGHGTEWVKVEHCFSNYEKEVAVIAFTHKGIDTQYWAGHYGSKMTGAKVYLTVPRCKE